MRVLTWNLWWRFGPWDARRKAILDVLREQRPDVVALQEVWANDGENLAGWLADELGLGHWTYARFSRPEHWQRRVPGDTSDIGVAVLSRWPIGAEAVLPLPADGGADNGRVALYARLDTPGGNVPVFTTHLNSPPYDSGVRCAQVRVLAEFVAEKGWGESYPPVIAGDFNAWPDSDEIRLLGGYKTAPPVPKQCFVDVWEYADPAAPSATWDSSNAYHTPGPTVRIDYIHVGRPGARGEGEVLDVARFGHGAVDGVWPSDHAGVRVDLKEAPE
ncbi:endonuclease/exonuclease/phosphatase family protein [Streptomyces sp. NBC_00237]|uniref:endonuclease/exonuclease/phosphatase family protein n=1 Tax=Streptomyces sp. NBC_00237 TaxID=2975687 RepID=UPI002255D336|nr:endonuclease/exonuclease/phosphatase family protein [Streptomyces sp. NBC_00237]MCX5204003.1 endonuclease/exonuclease/phosphatase family protein [Streptomyces sp. NBC_00237]